MEFKQNNKAAEDPVAGAQRRGASGKKTYTEADLTPEQKTVMNNMIKAGAPIKKEQYIADLAAMGEIK